jgi:predicted esterase
MRWTFVLFVFSVIAACNAQPGMRLAGDGPRAVYAKDSVLKIGGVEIWVQRPADSVKFRGTLLLLPGWDYSNHKWCDSTNVCTEALKNGYAVVAPQMMRSIYATRYFEETRQDLKNYPTLTWLDSALDILQRRHGLFSNRNYVLGLSTGGRGVALICEKKPTFFHAAAALSGDYNQYALPNDQLSTLVYGPFSGFSDRWKFMDNPVTGIDSFRTPIYLGHGALDKVAPLSQTQEFYDSLMQRRGKAVKNRNFGAAAIAQAKAGHRKDGGDAPGNPNIQLHIDPAGGHDFRYWRSELPAIWDFFRQH